jgi:hypothetical protein
MNNNILGPGYTTEFIFLTTYPKNTHGRLFIFNNSLEIVSSFDPVECGTPPCGYLDDFHMVDKTGIFIVGDYKIDIAGNIVGSVNTEADFGFTTGTTGADYEIGTWQDSGPSPYLFYDFLGMYGDESNPSLTLTTTYYSYKLYLACYDYQNAMNPIILGFDADNDSEYNGQILFLSSFPPAPLPASLLEDNSIPKFVVENVNTDSEYKSMFYTRDGIIVRHNSTWKLHNINTGEVTATSIAEDSHTVKTDYDLNGDYYYIFNTREKMLYKCHTWWKQ